jgi:hypothetical protein
LRKNWSFEITKVPTDTPPGKVQLASCLLYLFILEQNALARTYPYYANSHLRPTVLGIILMGWNQMLPNFVKPGIHSFPITIVVIFGFG